MKLEETEKKAQESGKAQSQSIRKSIGNILYGILIIVGAVALILMLKGWNREYSNQTASEQASSPSGQVTDVTWSSVTLPAGGSTSVAVSRPCSADTRTDDQMRLVHLENRNSFLHYTSKLPYDLRINIIFHNKGPRTCRERLDQLIAEGRV